MEGSHNPIQRLKEDKPTTGLLLFDQQPIPGLPNCFHGISLLVYKVWFKSVAKSVAKKKKKAKTC
jgi:hypothetical protein